MSDGPPWIQTIAPSKIPEQLFSRLTGLCGYHFALDEHARFTIRSEVVRGNQMDSEVSVSFVKLTFYGGEVFLIMDDKLSDCPLRREHYKFEHPNLYVYVQWKEREDPNEEWQACEGTKSLIYPNVSQGSEAFMEFKSGLRTGQIDVRVTITHE